jgi:hypothetical protein
MVNEGREIGRWGYRRGIYCMSVVSRSFLEH